MWEYPWRGSVIAPHTILRPRLHKPPHIAPTSHPLASISKSGTCALLRKTSATYTFYGIGWFENTEMKPTLHPLHHISLGMSVPLPYTNTHLPTDPPQVYVALFVFHPPPQFSIYPHPGLSSCSSHILLLRRRWTTAFRSSTRQTDYNSLVVFCCCCWCCCSSSSCYCIESRCAHDMHLCAYVSVCVFGYSCSVYLSLCSERCFSILQSKHPAPTSSLWDFRITHTLCNTHTHKQFV